MVTKLPCCKARLLLVGLFLSPLLSLAQKVEIGGALGGLVYKGDVSPQFDPRVIRPGGGLFFRYHPSRSFATRLQVSVGRITAADSNSSDAFQKARGARFMNTVREVALTGEYKFRNYTALNNVKNWTPYVFGGVALFNHGLRQEGEAPISLAFPLGVGIKYEFARPWSIGIEYGTRFTRNDTLDGLTQPDAATPRLSQNDPDKKDQYSFLAITLSYTFYRVFCP